jgi:cytochrome c-type biogenesis protein CcmH/NrfG
MARAAVKAKQAQKAKTQPAAKARARGRRRHAGGGNPNQQLFFVRMRRNAKPVYVVLAVLFAATFAFLGVGSGSSGLDQLFSGLNIFHHSGTSISSARNGVEKHPTDPQMWLKLATAYEAHGDTDLAVGALERYTGLKPKDAKVWSELAGLQMASAQDLVAQYQNAYAAEQVATPSAPLLPKSTSPFGKALGTNPIERAAATDLNGIVTDLATRAQGTFTSAVASYKQVATLQPSSTNAQFQLAQAASTAGDTATEIAAYKAYLKLNPDSSTAAQVRQLIKSLGG